MSRVNLRDIKNLAWEYYSFHRHRNREILIQDLQHVIIYIEQIIKNMGGKTPDEIEQENRRRKWAEISAYTPKGEYK